MSNKLLKSQYGSSHTIKMWTYRANIDTIKFLKKKYGEMPKSWQHKRRVK